MKRFHLNIRAKLLAVCIVGMGPMIIALVLVYTSWSGLLKVTVFPQASEPSEPREMLYWDLLEEEMNMAMLEKVAADVRRLFEPRKSEAELLTWNQEIQNLCRHYEATAAESLDVVEPEVPLQLQTIFRQFFTGPREVYAQICCLDAGGRLILKYARGSGTGPGEEHYTFATTDPDFHGMDLRSFEDRDTLFVSNEDVAAHGPVVRMGRWIRDLEDGRRIGFLLMDVEVDRFLQEAHLEIHSSDHFSQDGTIVIVEGEHHRLLFHSQEDMIGRDIAEILPGFAEVYPKIRTRERTALDYVLCTEGEEEWLVLHVNITGLDWTVALLTPYPYQSGFTQMLSRGKVMTLGISSFCFLLTVTLVTVVIGRVTGSIRKVTRAAEAISSGHLDQEIVVRSKDETSTLAAAFNRMSSSLRQTMGDLRRLNAELEARVRQRTSELEDSSGSDTHQHQGQ